MWTDNDGKKWDFDATVARAKAEILRHAKVGTVPRTVASFSELHDYVDANGYGGAFEIAAIEEIDVDFWNRVSDVIDQWIKAGGVIFQTREL